MLLNRADGADWASWAVSGQHMPSLGPEAQKAKNPKKGLILHKLCLLAGPWAVAQGYG